MRKLAQIMYHVCSDEVLIVAQEGRRTFFSERVTCGELRLWFTKEDYALTFNNKGKDRSLGLHEFDQDDRAKVARILDDIEKLHKGFQGNGKYPKTCSWPLMSLKTPFV